jgi:pimeloyl-ACP methyl ester carboxylesterase
MMHKNKRPSKSKNTSTETTFQVKGQKIAAKIWGNPNGIPTLAIHGWLDNAATFDKIAPLLTHCHLVAIDLPGHGFSDHKPANSYLQIVDYVVDMINLLDETLGWKQFALLGHSLGGAISSLIAGALPDRILKIAIIDGLGPMTTPAEHAPMQLRLYLQETLGKPPSRTPIYAHIEMAIAARIKVNPMMISSAHCIIERGLKQNTDGTYSWRTDPRLLKPSVLQLTEEQTIAFLEEITAPIMVIRPEPGFPFPEDLINRRISAVKHLQVHRLAGEHHVHLDNPIAVATLLNGFFK